MFLKRKMNDSTNSYSDKILQIKEKIGEADAIIIGAGAGFSTSAGFVYNGERFEKYFSDFRKKYGFSDMYSGGFYPYKTLEKHWGYWCRYIYINRYMDAPKPVYQNLYELVKEKDYFVLTTNVDHCFQKAGFDKNRIFYTQGDYGLFQCSEPCHKETYDNEETIKKMVLSQGFQIKDGELQKPEDGEIKLTVPTSLIPYCPHCGKPMSMNLRSDQTFVEDDGWHQAAERYENFIQDHKKQKIVFLELGVGYNTPGIIKFGFHSAVRKNKSSTYMCVNLFQAAAPDDIQKQSICINEDCGRVIEQLLFMNKNK